ncbi:MAG TPA: DUF2254 domain-containing protein [Myxococcaceae bacterium]|nr:DUF2254 domain-containing protein [Myxococcaceae bacterium]
MTPRVARLREHLKFSLWFQPMLFLLGGLVLGLVLPAVELGWPALSHALHGAWFSRYLPGTPDSGREMLIAMAAALATMLAVAASMTMVTVQLASAQITPRLLRRFLSDPITQRMLGFFLATVTYLLLVLGTLGSSQEGQAQAPLPLLSLAVAMVLTLVCLMLLPGLLHHAARSVEVASVISSVGREIISALRGMRYHPDAELGPERPGPDEPPTVLTAEQTGYLQLIDEPRLLSALPPGTQTVRLEVRPGDFLFPGLPLVSIWPRVSLEPRQHERLHAALAVGRERTLQQDVLYGVRQLVDMALKALSPGINDVTTALMVVNELSAVGCAVMHQSVLGRGWWMHRRAEVTLLTSGFGLGPFLDEAFTEIPRAAASQPRVLARILEVLAQLASLETRKPLLQALVQCGQAVREASGLERLREVDARFVEQRWQELQRAVHHPGALPVPEVH